MAKKLSCGINTWSGTAKGRTEFQSGDPNYLAKINLAMQQAQATAEVSALQALSDSQCPDKCGFPIGTYSTAFDQTVWTRIPNPIHKPGNPPFPDSFSVVVEYSWTVTVNCIDLLSWIQGKGKKLVIKAKP